MLPLQVIAVGEGVLVPRPETELLVDFALEASAAQGGALRSLPWADLGTGSGALAVALARGLPGGAAVGALDASPTALHWAAANAARLAGRSSSAAAGLQQSHASRPLTTIFTLDIEEEWKFGVVGGGQFRRSFLSIYLS